MKWINSKQETPKIDRLVNNTGDYEYKESNYVFAKVKFKEGNAINVYLRFTKSVTRPNEPIKVSYQHFISGAKHPKDFYGYSEINIKNEFIEEIFWLKE